MRIIPAIRTATINPTVIGNTSCSAELKSNTCIIGSINSCWYTDSGDVSTPINGSIAPILITSVKETIIIRVNIKIEYLDENNSKKSSTFKGFESRIIQHELDHLNGILFVDHLSRLKRDVIIRKMRKYKKEKELI